MAEIERLGFSIKGIEANGKILFRPEDWEISKNKTQGSAKAKVMSYHYFGGRSEAILQIKGYEIIVDFNDPSLFQSKEIWVRPKENRATYLK